LAKLLDQVASDREIIVIHRRKGEDVALVAADELSSLLETAHLLRSPSNARRLFSALNRVTTPSSVVSPTLEELRHQVDKSQKQQLSELLEAWYAEPDDLGDAWWDDFERELRENRFKMREVEFD
jgi:antitoxin YefM